MQLIANLRHYVFATVGLRWPHLFARCDHCDRWEYWKAADSGSYIGGQNSHLAPPETEAYFYCRTCRGRS